MADNTMQANAMMQRLLGQGLLTPEQAAEDIKNPTQAMAKWREQFGEDVNAVTDAMIEADPSVSVGPGSVPVLASTTPQPAQPGQAPQAGARSIYEDLTEEQLGEIAGMGDLDRQLAMAEQLRDTPALEGRYINQGRTYVADSPIAHAVRGARIHVGRKRAKRIGEEQTAGRRTIIDLLRNRREPEIALADAQSITDFDPTRSGGLA